MSHPKTSSMPEPDQQQASPRSSASHARNESPSEPNTLGPIIDKTLPETTSDRLGSLHLQPASIEELFEIDRFVYGEYDLIDGYLHWRGMSERNRNKEQAKNLLYHFHRAERKEPKSNRIGTIEATIVIPPNESVGSNQPSSSTSAPQCAARQKPTTGDSATPPNTVLHADLAIGGRVPDDKREGLSPGSRHTTFPIGFDPEVVVENTSLNESNDMKKKVERYARRNIKKYVVVNNDARAKHPNPAVHVGDLKDGKYEGFEIPHRGDDDVDLGPIGILKAKDCLFPGKPDERLHQEGRAQEEKIQKETETRKIAEQEKKEEQERRLKAEQEKKKEQERRLKAEQEKKKEQERRLKAEQEKKKEQERRLKAEQEKKKEQERRLKAEQEREEEEKRRLEEKKRRLKSEREKLKAEKKEQSERKKRIKEEERRRKAEAKLKAAGLVVSDSSSSSKSSPSRDSSSPRSSSSSRGSSSPRSPPHKKRK